MPTEGTPVTCTPHQAYTRGRRYHPWSAGQRNTRMFSSHVSRGDGRRSFSQLLVDCSPHLFILITCRSIPPDVDHTFNRFEYFLVPRSGCVGNGVGKPCPKRIRNLWSDKGEGEGLKGMYVAGRRSGVKNTCQKCPAQQRELYWFAQHNW